MPPAIPPDVAIKSSIRPGSVYYFPHESFNSPDYHYFIVINNDPFNEPKIITVCSSTRRFKVNSRSRYLPANTIVTILPDRYPGFTFPSIIDCNSFYPESIDGLVQRLKNNALQIKPEMDMKLVKLLREGVLSSPLIAENIKKLIRIPDKKDN